jgi:hypothetical protein
MAEFVIFGATGFTWPALPAVISERDASHPDLTK